MMNARFASACRALVTSGAIGAALLAGPAAAADDLALARASGCLVCHRGAEQRLGPAFADVAARYAGQAGAEARLAGHIRAGTGPNGVGWQKDGKARLPFMPANDSVTPENARRLAQWVLAVKGEIVDAPAMQSKRISIAGQVANPLQLDVAALRQFPVKSIAPPVSARQAEAGRSASRFTGVLLRDLLDKASISFGSHFDLKKTAIVATASDGYRVVFSWSELFASPIGDGVLVFFEKDGQPLADSEGQIALLSTNDASPSSRYLKWLQTVEVRRLND